MARKDHKSEIPSSIVFYLFMLREVRLCKKFNISKHWGLTTFFGDYFPS